MPARKNDATRAALLSLACALAAPAPAFAHGAPIHATKPPRELAVERRLAAPPAGIAELKFGELFKLPVGPKGLEPSARLRALDGRRVRIVGYMVQQETPVAGGFLLSPLPASVGDEDESLADDLPPSALFVALPKGPAAIVPPLSGLLGVTGLLRVGAWEIPGAERVAAARIELDPKPERALLGLARRVQRGSARAPR